MGNLVRGKPLEWWRVKALEYLMLATLALRVLLIPVPQAQSERVFWVRTGKSRYADTFSTQPRPRKAHGVSSDCCSRSGQVEREGGREGEEEGN